MGARKIPELDSGNRHIPTKGGCQDRRNAIPEMLKVCYSRFAAASQPETAGQKGGFWKRLSEVQVNASIRAEGLREGKPRYREGTDGWKNAQKEETAYPPKKKKIKRKGRKGRGQTKGPGVLRVYPPERNNVCLVHKSRRRPSGEGAG